MRFAVQSPFQGPVVLLDTPSAWLGAATLLVLVFTWLSRERPANVLAWLLCIMWAYAKAAAFLWGWDSARLLLPAGDVLGLAVASFVWYLAPSQWRIGVAFAILTKLFLHVGFWRDGISTIHSSSDVYNYTLSLNILFAVEIFCVALSGSGPLVSAVGSWMSAGRPRYRGHGVARGRHSPRSKGG